MDRKSINDSSFGAIVFFKNDNAILFALVHHEAGHWAFPKGHQIKGETKIETAKREIEEETGLKNVKIFANHSFLENYSFENENKIYNKTVKYFLGETENKNDLSGKNINEIKEAKWVTLEEAMHLLTFDSTKNILKKAYEAINKVCF